MAKSAWAYTADPWVTPLSRLNVLRPKKSTNAIRAQRCPRPIDQAINSQKPTERPAPKAVGSSWPATIACHASAVRPGLSLTTADLTSPMVDTIVIAVASSTTAPKYSSLTALNTDRLDRGTVGLSHNHNALLSRSRHSMRSGWR